MSSIKSVTPTLQFNNRKNLKKGQAAPSFGNAGEDVSQFVNTYARKHVEKSVGVFGMHRWLAPFTQFLARNKGEIQTQAINAVFTCTLAPAFIAFNPLSKKDKQTKQYTALRQPVSAFNAILISVPLTVLMNRHTEMIASKGYLKSVDLRSCPNKDYLGRMFDKAYKQAEKQSGNKDANIEKFLNTFSEENERNKIKDAIKADWGVDVNTSKFAKEYKSRLREAFVKKEQSNAAKFFARLRYEDPAVLRSDPELKKEAIRRNVENLDEYISEYNMHEISAKKFLHERGVAECFEDKVTEGGKKLIKLELKEEALKKSLKTRTMMDFLRRIGFVNYQIENDGSYSEDSFSKESLSKFIAEKRQEPVIEVKHRNHPNLKRENIVDEVVAQGKNLARYNNYTIPAEIRMMDSLYMQDALDVLKIKPSEFVADVNNLSAIEFANKYIGKLNGLEGLTGVANADLAKKLTKLDDLKEVKEAEIKEALKENNNIELEEIAKKLSKLNAFKDKSAEYIVEKLKGIKGLIETTVPDVMKQLVTNDARVLEKRFGGVKNYVGIFFNLFISAAACWTLNWSYPRFVEAFFPSLVKDKPQNGGNK